MKQQKFKDLHPFAKILIFFMVITPPLLTLAGSVLLFDAIKKENNYTAATAKVVAYTKCLAGGTGKTGTGCTPCPIYEYQNVDGKHFREKSNFCIDLLPDYQKKVGSTVEIKYSPNNPSDFIEVSQHHQKLAAFVMIGFGFFTGVIAVWGLLLKPKK